MRSSRNISKIVNQINGGHEVDWYSWEAKRADQALDFFTKKGLCKKGGNLKERYNNFIVKYYEVERGIDRILDFAIDKTPGLKTFMVIHSIFDHDANKKGDWLQRYMLKKLMPTEKEVYEEFNPEPIPKDLLERFKIFDPVQVTFEMDQIKIQYGMWRKDNDGRLVDPINVIHTDFDGIKLFRQADVVNEIAKYENIESDPVDSTPSDWVEDDLPF